MKLGSETGSLANHLHTRYVQPEPKVGMGCTLLGWTDRHAATVIEVKTPRKIVVQQDTAVRTDKNGMSECQEYTYTPNPNGAKYTFYKNKRGQWKQSKGSYGLTLNTREEYYDPSF
jgi:hypothetical protein